MKIRILVPTYNGARVLSETLRSILSQSFDDFEIIVYDDKPNDIQEVL